MRAAWRYAVVVIGVAAVINPGSAADARLWTVQYDPDTVLSVTALVGYHIDFEFAPNETFVNLGAGDTATVDVGAEGNHLFLKPKAVTAGTNLTVVTTRRTYHLDYRVARRREDLLPSDWVYAIRFHYPTPPSAVAPTPPVELTNPATRNTNYWFCGDASLAPTAAVDDGVRTRLEFAPRTELPAVFVKSADGAESLVNFHVEDGVVVIHRIAERFVLRRGQSVGCIENRSFDRTGVALPTGTVSPAAVRSTREEGP